MRLVFSYEFWRVGVFAIALGIFAGLSGSGHASPPASIIDGYLAEAKKGNSAFKGFSPERGRSLFFSNNTTGKPETPSCTSCHSKNPINAGQTRAGKEIAPMAVSRSPDRYTDPKKVKKWFRRNCKSVLGRICTPTEKGDFLTFMLSQ